MKAVRGILSAASLLSNLRNFCGYGHRVSEGVKTREQGDNELTYNFKHGDAPAAGLPNECEAWGVWFRNVM